MVAHYVGNKIQNHQVEDANAALLSLLLCTHLRANDYDDAWKAIHQKNFKEAKRLLQAAAKDPATALNAALTLVYIQAYQGSENKIDGLAETLLRSADSKALRESRAPSFLARLRQGPRRMEQHGCFKQLAPMRTKQRLRCNCPRGKNWWRYPRINASSLRTVRIPCVL